jgi:dihydroneopterin aldolase
MIQLITIELNGLKFFGHHGLYKEEQKIGGEFEINISISYEAPSTIINSIDETIN